MIRKHNRLRSLAAALLCMALLIVWLPGAFAWEGDAIHLLLIGEDASDAGNGRSDTMMLAQIVPATGQIRLVSFLRDTYLPIPGHGYDRLNAAYVYGGRELLCQTLTGVFGVRIDRTAKVDFAAMAGIVDRMGGVELEVSEAERKALNNILNNYCKERAIDPQPLAESGLVQMNGIQALSYSRVRSLDSDFVRVSRQQKVLGALLDKALLLEPYELLGLATECMGSVETDLSLNDLMALLPILWQRNELTLSTARVPYDGTCRDIKTGGKWVLETDTEANARLLAEFLSVE
jgi:LCP family protein required for cell wall assembly